MSRETRGELIIYDMYVVVYFVNTGVKNGCEFIKIYGQIQSLHKLTDYLKDEAIQIER